MAPGIFPAATSALMKASIRERFSTDSFASGGGPNWAAAADKARADTVAAMIVANNVTDLPENIDFLPLSVGRTLWHRRMPIQKPGRLPSGRIRQDDASNQEDSHEGPHELLPGGTRYHKSAGGGGGSDQGLRP